MTEENRTNREKEIYAEVGEDTTLRPLVHHVVYLESQLEELELMPKLRIHPKDPAKQKATPAAKLYKEYMQQYLNAIKILMRRAGTDEADEDSPLRAWFKAHADH